MKCVQLTVSLHQQYQVVQVDRPKGDHLVEAVNGDVGQEAFEEVEEEFLRQQRNALNGEGTLLLLHDIGLASDDD